MLSIDTGLQSTRRYPLHLAVRSTPIVACGNIVKTFGSINLSRNCSPLTMRFGSGDERYPFA